MKTCEGPDCGVEFEPKRSTARYHSATCRQRAGRARKAAAESVEADAAQGKDEHPLVRSVRAELVTAGRLDSFNGQLALQLARRLANPEESAVTTLSKELRAVMAAATADRPEDPEPTPDAGQPADADDEIRRKRDAKRQAAREAAR